MRKRKLLLRSTFLLKVPYCIHSYSPQGIQDLVSHHNCVFDVWYRGPDAEPVTIRVWSRNSQIGLNFELHRNPLRVIFTYVQILVAGQASD